MGTDEDWEEWGRTEPYFGVATHESYRSTNMDAAARERFFDSGAENVEDVLQRCRKLCGEDFAPKTALDFGCGVGRMTVPLARVCDRVVGVDVSRSMLSEAGRNAAAFGLDNIDLRQGDDRLSLVPETFDLVNSLIVLQHIAPRRGIRLFEELVKRVAPGGAGAIQLTYSKRNYVRGRGLPDRYLLEQIGDWFLPVHERLRRLIPRKVPQMKMHQYHLNQVFFVLQSQGVAAVEAAFTDHGGQWGVSLVFRREGEEG